MKKIYIIWPYLKFKTELERTTLHLDEMDLLLDVIITYPIINDFKIELERKELLTPLR